MTIKTMTIAGEGAGGDIELARTDTGALAMRGNDVIAAFEHGDAPEARYAKAARVTCLVYGTWRGGRPAATNSMVHDLLDAIERVGGF